MEQMCPTKWRKKVQKVKAGGRAKLERQFQIETSIAWAQIGRKGRKEKRENRRTMIACCCLGAAGKCLSKFGCTKWTKCTKWKSEKRNEIGFLIKFASQAEELLCKRKCKCKSKCGHGLALVVHLWCSCGAAMVSRLGHRLGARVEKEKEEEEMQINFGTNSICHNTNAREQAPSGASECVCACD